ncbi:helix-turn-helix domain-containing protein [Micromonospora sp. WMMD882]|uniref:helix-turn-helix domain-containing protein n=1 Tax=Micromonospora sp. WMMD882 TaxID=3015151 RepID=UPI00248CB382|nr:helix-turn-helix domain-containing protein [Micromonospora sp. WMMD882]WBB77294.1 helix-turn-helix domain-containing protein [Micromonospora sp. WMMD882]
MKYTVECARSGSWWAITVPELKGVFSQARRLDQVESMAREAIGLMLEVAPDSFDVEIKPVLPDQVVRAREARVALRQAERSAEETTRYAAVELIRAGYTVRDIGELLGISPQRVSQITQAAKTEGKQQAA